MLLFIWAAVCLYAGWQSGSLPLALVLLSGELPDAKSALRLDRPSQDAFCR